MNFDESLDTFEAHCKWTIQQIERLGAEADLPATSITRIEEIAKEVEELHTRILELGRDFDKYLEQQGGML